MSHFYGTLQGTRGEATRQGDKRNGLAVHAASWQGAVYVYLNHNERTGKDEFRVSLTPWHGSGVSKPIATGNIDGTRSGTMTPDAKRSAAKTRKTS